MARRGDIALARFPFTNLSGAKLRPVLVIAEALGPHRDYIVLFISSRRGQAAAGVDLLLDASDPAFARTGLKLPSVVRIAKVATISDALIIGTLGRLDQALFDEVVRRFTRLVRRGRWGGR